MNAHKKRSERVDHLMSAANSQRPRRDAVPVFDTPEPIMVISFVGISRAEQEAALAGFPGGRRFVLGDA